MNYWAKCPLIHSLRTIYQNRRHSRHIYYIIEHMTDEIQLSDVQSALNEVTSI